MSVKQKQKLLKRKQTSLNIIDYYINIYLKKIIKKIKHG